MVVPGSFHTLEQKEMLKPWHIFTVIPRAFEETQGIIFFIFIIGGALAVIRATGVIDAFMGRLIQKYGSKPYILMFSTMLVFSVASSTLGMAEEFIPFVPILLMLCLALDFDRITAIGIMVVGYGIGYGVAALNPFTVMVAQEVAQLKPTSGFGYRLALFLPFFLLGFHHVYAYSKKVRKDPSRSLLKDNETMDVTLPEKVGKITRKNWIILIFILAALILIVYGISEVS